MSHHSSTALTLRSSRKCGKTHCEINSMDTIQQQSDWNNSVLIKTLKKHLTNFSSLPPPKILFPLLYPSKPKDENDDDYYDDEEEEDVSDGSEFNHVSKEEARKVIEMMFTKDLAYNSVLKTSSKAASLASSFIEIFESSEETPNETIYFSNSEVNPTHGKLYTTSSNLTNATFDSGVLAMNLKYFGFIVIEDED